MEPLDPQERRRWVRRSERRLTKGLSNAIAALCSPDCSDPHCCPACTGARDEWIDTHRVGHRIRRATARLVELAAIPTERLPRP